MSPYDAGVEVDFFNISYSLPRTGKDIIVTQWSENGREMILLVYYFHVAP